MNRVLAGAAGAALALTTAACAGSSSPAGAPSSPASTAGGSATPAPASVASDPAPSGSSAGSSPASGSPARGASPAPAPQGSGCADILKRVPGGPRSLDALAKDPVAVAASHTPLLSTLVAALSGTLNPRVNLVDTLDAGEFTVFAPVDAAFRRMPAATMAKLRTDPGLLTTLLTYHVLPRRLSPDAILGQQETVQGATVTVTGTPGALTVNGATVLCGGVRTANAAVYLIDDVLTPPA